MLACFCLIRCIICFDRKITCNTRSFNRFKLGQNIHWSKLNDPYNICVISSSKCGVVLFVILCGVWFWVLLRCSFSSYWKIDISQLQIQSMIWASTLQIRKHEYFGDLDFLILFVGIWSLYAINSGIVSMFADSPFTFLAMFVCDVLYQFEWMNICFCKKKKRVTFVLLVRKKTSGFYWVWFSGKKIIHWV